ncbi:cobyric acid synthase [Alkalihalobacterium alkalinitrilicum]|uniref:cobyric acid synthase n=1 Tax=Alkalihalobacterium alkalinitrilicum TaxID=427920 RepID=UPI00099545DD|nr:cobyric acid synthase [Alkalihalobacterium alkalinitrilicum]
MKGIMFQGTGSDVGKSVIVTGICRILARKNKRVAPFKSQNMSNNSYVTIDGKEIGRAQGVQAEAAHTQANVYMNPILLKPRSSMDSEVVLFGEVYTTFSGRNYRELFYEKGIRAIQQALTELENNYDYVVIEGAGSPVEINLNDRELVNMKVAELADVPVILIADIERGGVFASVIGTIQLLSEEQRKRVKGIIINKFRGDISLFTDGVSWLEEYTGIKVVGVIPYYDHISIEGEDSLSIQNNLIKRGGREENDIDIAVIALPYVSNYTDLEPLTEEKDVYLRFVKDKRDFGKPDAVIIPGTKSTFHDLTFLKETGLDIVLSQYVQAGGTIIGLCGGYQMLGEKLIDEAGTDTGIIGQTIEGLKIAPLKTHFNEKKITIRSKGKLVSSHWQCKEEIVGFEIHLGSTVSTDKRIEPFLEIEERTEGICINNGQVIGTYFHHVFHNDEWRTAWLNQLRVKKGLQQGKVLKLQEVRDLAYDRLADHVEMYLDLDYVIDLIESWKRENE